MRVNVYAMDMTMRIEGIRNDKGTIRLSVCTENEFLTPTCKIEKAMTSHMGVVIFHVDLPSGTAYSILAHHDENDDKMIDMDWLGIPEEGLGFSRKDSSLLERPKFIDTSFVPEKKNKEITVHLFYYD
jgi:hypothetical protein